MISKSSHIIIILCDIMFYFNNYLAPEETNLFTTAFKKSYEYEDIQMILEPIVAKALNESRGTAPQFTTYFLWQVYIVIFIT